MLHISTNQTIKKYRGIIMKKISWKLIAAFVCSSFLSGTAQAVLIDFEQFSGIPFSPGTAIPLESQISDQLLSTDGVLFSSDNSPFIAAVELGQFHATSGIIGVGGTDTSGNLSYSDIFFKANFFDPSHVTHAAVTDFVSVRTDRVRFIDRVEAVTFSAFDINGNLLGQNTQDDTGGLLLTLAFDGIHSVTFRGVSATALDDFSFNPVTSVPIPAAAWLFGTGLIGLLNFTKKRASINYSS